MSRAKHKIIDGRKKCASCNEIRDIKDFNMSRMTKSKLRASCKFCLSKQGRERKYGLTDEQFNLMLKNQDYKCFICKVQLTLIPYTPTSACVDHNHKTGKIRAIVCHTCNRIIGMLHDDPNFAHAMASYLESFTGDGKLPLPVSMRLEHPKKQKFSESNLHTRIASTLNIPTALMIDIIKKITEKEPDK